MTFRFGSSVLVILLTTTSAPNPALYAGPSQATAAPPAARGVAAFVRVFPLDTPNLSAPVAIQLSSTDIPRALTEIGGSVELEITVGTDGYVRDGMIQKALGGSRVEALALRAAANSRFQPGTLDGRPVPVRMPLILTLQNP